MSNKNDFPNRFIHTDKDIDNYVSNMLEVVEHPNLNKKIAKEGIKKHLLDQIDFSNKSDYYAVKSGDPFWDIICGLLDENHENLMNNTVLNDDTYKKLDNIHYDFMYRFDSKTIKDDLSVE